MARTSPNKDRGRCPEFHPTRTPVLIAFGGLALLVPAGCRSVPTATAKDALSAPTRPDVTTAASTATA